MLTSIYYNCSAISFVIQDNHFVLKVKVDPEFVRGQVYIPKFASFGGDLLPVHLLENIEVLIIHLDDSNLLKYSV